MPNGDSPEPIVELGRMNALNDGMYAIALTLLIFDIKLPDDVLVGDLPSVLLELVPKLLIYLISFVVIGGAWGSHQRMFSQIRRGDGLLVWYNLLSLLFVTLLPASASLLGRFPSTFLAIVCFAVDVMLIQLSALWLWRHVSKNGLVKPTLDPHVMVGIGRRLLIITGAFALSLPLVLLNPVLVYVVWVGVFIFMFTTDWLSWQQTSRSAQVLVPLEGATRGHLDVVHHVGSLSIRAGTAPAVFVQGTCGGGADSQITREDDLLTTRLSVEAPKGFMNWRYPWAWGSANTLEWTLGVAVAIPLTLNVTTSIGETDLNLSNLRVTDLNLTTNSNSANVVLPVNVDQTTVKISGSTAYIVIQVPAHVAAKIYMVNAPADATTTIELDLSRFSIMENGQEYRSSTYDTAANRADIRIDIKLGTVKII